MSPAWHEEARKLRADGLTQAEIARAMRRSPESVRYALNANGEQERARERARKSGASIGVVRSRRGESEAENVSPHVTRQPARILPAPSDIMALCRQFAEHKIDRSESSRTLRVSG